MVRKYFYSEFNDVFLHFENTIYHHSGRDTPQVYILPISMSLLILAASLDKT